LIRNLHSVWAAFNWAAYFAKYVAGRALSLSSQRPTRPPPLIFMMLIAVAIFIGGGGSLERRSRV